jgi:hypothetical protein
MLVGYCCACILFCSMNLDHCMGVYNSSLLINCYHNSKPVKKCVLGVECSACRWLGMLHSGIRALVSNVGPAWARDRVQKKKLIFVEFGAQFGENGESKTNSPN